MPIMRMPWSKSGNLQLDLLDASAAPDAVSAPPAVIGAIARSLLASKFVASNVVTGRLAPTTITRS